MPPVTYEQRGREIQRRRLAHGFRSVREFQEHIYESTGLSREAVGKAEKGTASLGTYVRLEAWLDAYDHEVGEDQPEPIIEQLEFLVEGEGVSVTVKGPVSDREALEASVAKIIRSIRGNSPGTG